MVSFTARDWFHTRPSVVCDVISVVAELMVSSTAKEWVPARPQC
jgi:hypothetical protein